jgi:hypothetical protein
MARRRTAEIRLGNDGKLSTTTNGYDDTYRPRSPIDRIKSLFGGGAVSSLKKTTSGTSPYTASKGVTSRYTPSSGTSNAPSSSQFKRYTGGNHFYYSIVNDMLLATTNTRYVPGGRHWYD